MKTLILLNGSKAEPVQEFVPVKQYIEIKILYRCLLDHVLNFLDTAWYTADSYYFDRERFQDFQRLCQTLRLSFLNQEDQNDAGYTQ